MCAHVGKGTSRGGCRESKYMLTLRGARIHMRALPPPVYVLVCTRRYALPPARQIPELTLLLHVAASSSPLRRAQKTVSRAIDGALKSNILICVRWYSPINILSGVHGIPRSVPLQPSTPPTSISPHPFPSPFCVFGSFRCPCKALSDVTACSVCALSSLPFAKKTKAKKCETTLSGPACEIDSPGICACPVGSLHSSDSSDCT